MPENMPEIMLSVSARPGIKVPLEGAPKRYIDGGPADGDPAAREVAAVPDSPYYQRQLADGDLALIEPGEPKKTTAKKGEKS